MPLDEKLSHEAPTLRDEKEELFKDAQLAFRQKSLPELLRTWLIFRVCAIGFVVRHCDSLYGLSRRLLGARLTNAALRHTLFGHFCAGESAAGIVPRIEHLRSRGDTHDK